MRVTHVEPEFIKTANEAAEFAEALLPLVKENQRLVVENSHLRSTLQTVIGHSNCYCVDCKELSKLFWWPSDGGPPTWKTPARASDPKGGT
jgi:regulator of replication initiation timing